jgi:hypothetical protein
MLAFMTYDDEHHRIAIAALPGLEEQPPLAVGTEHVAFTHADLGDLLLYVTFGRADGDAHRTASPSRGHDTVRHAASLASAKRSRR